MDADYGRNRDRDGGPFTTFEPSLYVWSTVMSRPTEDRAIVDAGLKALAFDSGPPIVCDEPAAAYGARLRRARRARSFGRHQPARARRKDPADPRPLRPDRQPLRLVRLHPRQPRRAALADHHAGRGILMRRLRELPAKRVLVIPPARRPCAARRNTWLRTRRGSSAPRTVRRPSDGRCSNKNPHPSAYVLRRVRRRRVQSRL
jgi:putative serine dehydratase-like protein